MAEPSDPAAPPRTMGLWGATSLVVGSVVGSGIFLAPGLVAANAGHPGLFLLVWAVGGALSLLAALSLAELGAMYPRAGGQYVFLREAFGDGAAFLFGWMALVVNYSGTIAAVAVAFATALQALSGYGGLAVKVVAIAAIWVLTAVNVLGMRYGSGVQVASTAAKTLALAALVALGLSLGSGPDPPLDSPAPGSDAFQLVSGFGLSLVAALFAFDGMASATFVGGEIRDPSRTIPRATVLGAVAVTLIYLAVNLSILFVVPMERLAGNVAAAFEAGRALAGARGADVMAVAIALATFGTVNGYVLQSPRIYFAMARHGLLYGGFGRLDARRRAPVFGLIIQAEWCSLLVLSGTFDQLLTYVVMSSWIFLGLTGLALFRLRRTRPDAPRPYRVWGYPWVPALFVASALLLVANSLAFDPRDSLVGVGLALSGFPVYVFLRRRRARARTGSSNTDS